jgi:hypothetical protein
LPAATGNEATSADTALVIRSFEMILPVRCFQSRSMLRCFLREFFLAVSAWLREIVGVAFGSALLRFDGAGAIGVAVWIPPCAGWVSIGIGPRFLTIALDRSKPLKQKGGSGLMKRRPFLGLSAPRRIPSPES